MPDTTMHKVLIIHLVRFGDIIQTLSVIDMLHQGDVRCEVHMLIERGLAFFPEHHTGVARVIAFDPAVHHDLVSGITAWDSFSDETKALINTCNDETYDRVINLQHGVIGPVLMHYINAPVKAGSSRADKGTTDILDVWTEFLFLIAKKRSYNAMNLLDIYCRITGCASSIVPGRIQLTDAEISDAQICLKEWGVPLNDTYVCVQAGASKDFRRWHEDHFRFVCEYITRECGCTVVLLGVPAERIINDHIANGLHGVINLCGKTDFATLLYVLQYARLLLTNDTGTMHAGAYVGTETMVLSMSEVSAHETAPYATDRVVCVEPRLPCYPCEKPAVCTHAYACRTHVQPAYIARLIQQLLNNEDIRIDDNNEPLCDVLMPDIVAGEPYYVSLFPRSVSEKQCVQEIIRYALPYIWHYRAGEIVCAETVADKVYERVQRRFILDPLNSAALLQGWYETKQHMTECIRKGLVLTHAYQQALAHGDSADRRRYAQELEALDSTIQRAEGNMSFFAYCYDLEYRMMGSHVQTVQSMIDENEKIFLRIQTMLSLLNDTVKECVQIHERV